MTTSTPLNRRLLTALLAPALVLGACARGGDDAAAPPVDSVATAAPAPPAAPTSTVTDPQIAMIVVVANATDSTGGEQAMTMGTNPKVKEFAQRMITDHGGVNQQAVALATRLGVTPEESPVSRQLGQGGEQVRQQLSGLSGAAYDRAYIDNEVEYHETVLDAIDRTLIPSAQNAELRALLEATRPAIQAHLDHARQLQAELAGS
jgi:putative membrane protein